MNNNTTFVEEEVVELEATKLYVLASIVLLTLAGNGCVLASILSRPESTMTRVYFFMFHLSVADVITAFLTLLPEFIWTLTFPSFYGGNFVCKGVKFLQMVGPYLSSYVLTMTALDRYQAICYPLTNHVWTSSQQYYMIAIAWIISLLLCIPQSFIFAGDPVEPTCSASFQPGWGVKAYVTWFSISNFFVPLGLLTFSYVCICAAIWRTLGRSNAAPPITVSLQPQTTANTTQGQFVKATNQVHLEVVDGIEDDHDTTLLDINNGTRSESNQEDTCTKSPEKKKKKRRRHDHEDDGSSGLSRAKMRSVQQTVVVILTYIACSTPFIFAQLWVVWGKPSQAVINSMVWLFWLLTLNSVVNPWIYLAFNRELRTPVIKWVTCYKRRRRNQDLF